jgi:hypothetical protein
MNEWVGRAGVGTLVVRGCNMVGHPPLPRHRCTPHDAHRAPHTNQAWLRGHADPILAWPQLPGVVGLSASSNSRLQSVGRLLYVALPSLATK